MLLPEQSMILMVKMMRSCHSVLVTFFDLLPRESSHALEVGSWVVLMAAVRELYLLIMLRFVVSYFLL